MKILLMCWILCVDSFFYIFYIIYLFKVFEEVNLYLGWKKFCIIIEYNLNIIIGVWVCIFLIIGWIVFRGNLEWVKEEKKMFR